MRLPPCGFFNPCGNVVLGLRNVTDEMDVFLDGGAVLLGLGAVSPGVVALASLIVSISFLSPSKPILLGLRDTSCFDEPSLLPSSLGPSRLALSK